MSLAEEGRTAELVLYPSEAVEWAPWLPSSGFSRCLSIYSDV